MHSSENRHLEEGLDHLTQYNSARIIIHAATTTII